MAELGDLLREAVGEVGADAWSVDDVVHRASRRRRRQRVGGALATVAVVVGVAVGAMTGGDRSGVDVVDQPQPPTGGQSIFSTPTGVALLLDDGYDGVTALDLDTGVVGRRVVDGQRAGDQPYRLFRSGDSLIVGWGEVFAAPLDGGPSVSLGEATVAVPVVEPGRVWLATWAGGSVGQGELTMRRVDLHGNVEKTELLPSDPALMRTPVPDGVLPPVPLRATVMAVGPDVVVANCDPYCDRLTVYRRGEPAAAEVPLPAGVSLVDVESAAIALAPDGSRLAFVTPFPGRRVVVLDLGTGRLEADEPVDGPVAFPVWSPDGRQLFWVTLADRDGFTVVGRYQSESGATEAVRLPISGSLRAVAVDRAEAGSFLPADPASDPDSCPPPNLQPSNRTGTCGFRVTSRPA